MKWESFEMVERLGSLVDVPVAHEHFAAERVLGDVLARANLG